MSLSESAILAFPKTLVSWYHASTLSLELPSETGFVKDQSLGKFALLADLGLMPYTCAACIILHACAQHQLCLVTILFSYVLGRALSQYTA